MHELDMQNKFKREKTVMNIKATKINEIRITIIDRRSSGIAMMGVKENCVVTTNFQIEEYAWHWASIVSLHIPPNKLFFKIPCTDRSTFHNFNVILSFWTIGKKVPNNIQLLFVVQDVPLLIA